ncbi:MAG: hypothetical protein AAFN77_02020 [Planctomycetota bacterium]
MSNDPDNEQDMAPWAHPKAQAWFHALFNRSQFGFMLEDVVKQPVESMSREQMRAILTFAVLLGRKEIWPEEHEFVLKLILEKARAVAKKITEEEGKRPLTLRQHRSHKLSECEFQDEIEILRRRLGRSFKTTKLSTPDTWGPFWT